MPHRSKSPDATRSSKTDAQPKRTPKHETRGTPASTGEARVVQADAPVAVPQPPARPDASTPDVAREQSAPPRDPDDGHSWADNALPAPNKKNARTSLF